MTLHKSMHKSRRETLRDEFLNRTDWRNTMLRPLAGDASNRKYLRLINGPGGRNVVLMDAAPELGENVRPFVTVATFLRGLGLSAPEILAEDPTNGFLILEDLGDALFARVLKSNAVDEQPLYAAAVDVLAVLADAGVPDFLTPYRTDLARLSGLAFDWYRKGALGATGDKVAHIRAMESTLAQFDDRRQVLAQRDFHAENLIWLPERKGAARVGLLDFQDARACDTAYDLVSLLEDARRDVSPDLRAPMQERLAAATGDRVESLAAACAVFGAQRNLRIIGVFARLSMHFGKPHYVDLIPRVWMHLMGDLDHPALADMAKVIKAELPYPSPEILARLKALCGTVPTL